MLLAVYSHGQLSYILYNRLKNEQDPKTDINNLSQREVESNDAERARDSKRTAIGRGCTVCSC